MLVPLHNLGSDQVQGYGNAVFGVESCYIDENCFAKAKSLQKRLHLYIKEEAEENCMVLYVSPISIREYSDEKRKHKNDWFSIFFDLAIQGFISPSRQAGPFVVSSWMLLSQ